MNELNETPAIAADLSDNDESYLDVVIEAASVGNLLSARRRLAQLYHTGSGVEQNNAEAVRWYSLSAIQAMNEFNANPTLETADAAFNILLELGELHYEIGDAQRSINTFLRMEFMLDSLPEELRSSQTDRWLQICSNKLGSLYERTAKPQQAYGHFRRALDIAAKAAENDTSELTRDDLAVASYRVGFMDYLFRGQRDNIDRAYEIWSELYEQTGNFEYRRKKGVIDTLFATADVPDEQSSDEAAADISENSEQIAPSSSDADVLAEELAEYIREHGYSKSGVLEGMRPVLDIIFIIAVIALCVWAYFAGFFHDIFYFFRNL